ncbi:uncharacterized protein LOC142226827 [Haematobia irritans]|uniref:uncharacterized protein LOC142226827 n=1 Tax=Haematobia irritans TaxID=7368 RepID=UPI003F50019B
MFDGDLATIISEQECKSIVKKYNDVHEKNFKMSTYSVIPAAEVKGFLGEYYHLIIQCRESPIDVTDNGDDENELPDHECVEVDANSNEEDLENDGDDDAENISELKFFIKKLPLVHEEHEKVIIFRKESCLYNTLLKELQEYCPLQWCPKIYLSSSNLLVLQDLDECGYHSLGNKDTLDDCDIHAILKGLAAIHACSLLYELYDKSIEDNHYECLKEITVHPDIPWFKIGLKAILEIAKYHPQYQEVESQRFIEQELPYWLKSIYFMVNPSPKYRNVVCHRDPWGGNIFINPDDSEAPAIFVDFQTCRYCPPIIDVIFMLFLNLSKEDRLEKEKYYLEYYWQQLQNFIKSDEETNDSCCGLSESEFWESYDEFKLFGYVYRALAKTILGVPKEMVTDEYKNVERTIPLLSYMKENEEFRLEIEDCVEDIIETVVEMSLKYELF